jgi:glutamate-1-semialdehyde 2,1-aminomutase
VRIARRATGRSAILKSGYNGWHDWCLPTEDYVPRQLGEDVVQLTAINPEALERALRAEPGRFAAVIVASEAVEQPGKEVFCGLIRAAHEHGAVFILDEIKTGVRTRGGSIQNYYDFTPDLTTISKALGNGWPISAVIGRREVMSCAEGMHNSGTYHGELASMAAAIATMAIVDRDNVQERVHELGLQLIHGLNRSARSIGFPAEAIPAPIPAMPFLRLTEPNDALRTRLEETLYGYAISAGLLVHPKHMWFLSASHSDSDIETAIDILSAGMAKAATLATE